MAEDYVCWSRMQAEAGQAIEAIIARKEAERRAGDGLFLWGVGNPPARAASALARLGVGVRTVLSLMKTKPKAEDMSPGRVVAWRRYVDLDGYTRRLPANAIVTSRADSATGAKTHHAALMCFSPSPLSFNPMGESFNPDAFVNVGPTGGPVGASQVTALLRRVARDEEDSAYRANLVAQLAESYWVRLVDPVELNGPRIAALNTSCGLDSEAWLELAEWVRQDEKPWVARARSLEAALL